MAGHAQVISWHRESLVHAAVSSAAQGSASTQYGTASHAEHWPSLVQVYGQGSSTRQSARRPQAVSSRSAQAPAGGTGTHENAGHGPQSLSMQAGHAGSSTWHAGFASHAASLSPEQAVSGSG